MKKLFATLLGTVSAACAMAQLNGAGYYRLQNYGTQRYAYVIDNHYKVQTTATDVDLDAIELWPGQAKCLSDPASVLYIKPQGSGYDIQAQGTGIYAMSGHALTVKARANNTYVAYATESGLSLYLGDSEDPGNYEGYLVTNAEGDNIRWYILPVSATSDNYFGLQPTVEAGGKYYASFYVAFPFSCASEGMKVYTYTALKNGQVQRKELTGVIPAATPVIIECSSNEPTNNRLNFEVSSTSAPKDNLLAGVYFFSSYQRPTSLHYNRTAYNAQTMRLLGLRADGTVGFVKSSTEWLPANQAYLVVPEGTADELEIVDEFTADPETPEEPEIPASLTTIKQDASERVVYTLTGRRVRTQQLPAGIYMVDGKKLILK